MPLNLNYLYERDTSVMSKAANPKAGKMSEIHFLTLSRSLRLFKGNKNDG